jgi:heme oxygenase
MLESSFHDPLSAQINAKTRYVRCIELVTPIKILRIDARLRGATKANDYLRSHHTVLNRLITDRLPLCLPPYTSGPEVYAAGISHFAEIFCAFEEVWDEIIGADGNNKGLEETWEALDEQYPNGSAADLLSFLRTLRPHGLARSERLRTDFAYLQGLKGTKDVLQRLEKSKAVEDFVAHIHSEVQGNPHLLVAYGWTLYMAIFSGGRWIRAQLRNAGKDYWTASSSTSSVKPDNNDKPTLEELKEFENLGLGLWFFEGEQDGEDIKAEFKRRLNDGEHILTPAQRDDIILESQDIFDRFKNMVDDLDAAFSKASLSPAVPETASKKMATAKVKALEKKATEYLFDMPGYAGLALVVSCVSWYAMYHAGTWS